MTDPDALTESIAAHFTAEDGTPRDAMFSAAVRALATVATHMTHLPDTAEHRAEVWPTARQLNIDVAALGRTLQLLGALVAHTSQRAREILTDDPTLYDDRHHPNHPASHTASAYADTLTDAAAQLHTAAHRLHTAHDRHGVHLGHN